MIPEQQMYIIAAVVMAFVALAFAFLVLRITRERRVYYVPVPMLAAVMGLAYLLMSQGILELQGPEGEAVVLPRLLGYAVVYTTLMVYIGAIGGLSRHEIAILAGLNLAVIGCVSVSWLVPPPLGTAGSVVMVGLLAVTAYLLLFPYARIAAEREGERTLLYGKLRNLVLLLWGLLVVIGLISTQGLGLLDRFAGIFVATYIDLLSVLGFGLILLRSRDAVDLLIEQDEQLVPTEADSAG